MIAETRFWNSDIKDFEDKYWVQGPDDESFREKQKDERLSINALGDEGWELVSVFDTNEIQGASRDVVAVFKRPLN